MTTIDDIRLLGYEAEVAAIHVGGSPVLDNEGNPTYDENGDQVMEGGVTTYHIYGHLLDSTVREDDNDVLDWISSTHDARVVENENFDPTEVP